MKKILFTAVIAAAAAAQADTMDRPSGFKIGQRMTIRPYVALYYTYDSNVDQSHKSHGTSSWNVNPVINAEYKGDNWTLDGGAYYQYHAYSHHGSRLDQNSYGENLSFRWSNSKDGGKGWSLILKESFAQISQDDDMSNDGGRGVGRDRRQANFAGALEHRFTDKWHADVNATYYYLDYLNNSKKYAPLYGWTRWTAGAQAGYAASRWTDFLLAANYQGYTQDNDFDYSGMSQRKISSESKGWTVHVGLGSHATERISYRLMGGWSRFDYGHGLDTMNGFTYQGSLHWKMTDNWNMMLLASSYYQPSEYDYGSATRNDIVSWGLAHTMVRGKLNTTLDLAYRRQTREYTYYESNDYDEDIITARICVNYILNRFLTVFTRAEYQTCFFDGGTWDNNDYDRWRLSLGLRLTY